MWLIAIGLTVTFMTYNTVMFVASRRHIIVPSSIDDGLFFVFLVPCLNEELVIGASIDRLLALPGDRFAILVVDDGSTDRTAEIVQGYDRQRVWLLQRMLPDAQQGKGAALNAAYNYLRRSGRLQGHRLDQVVLAVVDADGRVEPDVLFEVAPYFGDPGIGAVQIGVRMYNAGDTLLARLQDFEFVSFTEVFQRARHQIGSSGLGGNGQFNRFSALNTLGDEPWTDCLTEDLDLGICLLASGWRNAFCSTTWVNQQALTNVRRLIRQRGRWFQGHLQCWRRLGIVIRAPVKLRATADLVHNLVGPALVLLMSLSVALFVASSITVAVVAPAALAAGVTASHGLPLVIWYALSFGLALPYAFAYWLHEPSIGFLRAILLGHLFTFYSFLWFIAGWLAIARMVRRSHGWQKTERAADVRGVSPDPEPALAA